MKDKTATLPQLFEADIREGTISFGAAAAARRSAVEWGEDEVLFVVETTALKELDGNLVEGEGDENADTS